MLSAKENGMTIGPHGEKRPSDTIANAVHVAKLATGEIEEEYIDAAKQAGGAQGRRGARRYRQPGAAPRDRPRGC